MQVFRRRAAALAGVLLISGCASLPPGQGIAESNALFEQRSSIDHGFGITDAKASIPDHPIEVEQAVRLAFANSPRMRGIYAQLGFAQAEVEAARRIANPTFSIARLEPDDGGGRQTTRSLALGFSDLLLMPARKRYATGEFERAQLVVAAELLALAHEVEVAWFTSVGAGQVASMRAIVARSAEASAELAQRFLDAGNISRLQLEQERAAATQARIAAVRSHGAARRARAELAALIGARSSDRWTTSDRLGAPSGAQYDADELTRRALDERLDLAAARAALALHEDTLGTARRWRWLGGVELGYERETGIDGGVMRGPSLALALPIFDQGQASIARAKASTDRARSEAEMLALSIRNAANSGIERMNLARDIAERYRDALLPAREAIVARSQEQVNFMLIGVFELIRAKQEEYDAYQEYLEAVRDYWIARADLRQIAGGRLPDDDAPLVPSLGVDGIVPTVEPPLKHDMHHLPDAPQPASDDAEPAHHHHGDTP